MKVYILLFVSLCVCIILRAQDTTNSYLNIIHEFESNNREKFYNSNEKIQKHYMRYRTWWDYRLDKNQNIKAYRKAWLDYYKDKMFTSVNNNKTLSLYNWEQIGPSDQNLNIPDNVGRCVSIAVDPTNSNIVYMGNENGGLWKTTNALDPASGVSWVCLTDNLSSLGVWSIAIKPDNPNTLFFVGGIRQVNVTGGEKFYSLGVFKSTDGGNSFTNILPLDPDDDIALTQILYDPINTNIMYIVGDNLLLKSTDGGNNFTLIQSFQDDAELRQMVINTTNSNEYMIGGYNGTVLLYTNDGGQNFYNLYNPNIFGSNAENIFPAYNPSNGYFYVCCFNGIFKTNDGGSTWSIVDHNPSHVEVASYVTHMKIANNGDIYAGGVQCNYFSNDIHVSNLSGSVHADVRAVGFSNSTNGAPVFVANDGGISRCLNGGYLSWESINGNLAIGQFYDLSICGSNEEVMYGGTLDCGTLKRTEVGSWIHVDDSDGGGTSVNDENENYCLCSMGSGSQRLRYTTDGNNFSYCQYEQLIKYNTPIVRDPTNPAIVYTGVWHLDKSDNNGINNFSIVHDGGGTYVTCIDISPLNSNYIAYAEYQNYLPQQNTSSLNIYNGQSWLTINSQTNPYPFAQNIDYIPIVNIEFSPINANTVYICFGGV